MRKTEDLLLRVLSWIHAVLLFATLYLFLPSFIDQSMTRFFSDFIYLVDRGYVGNLIQALILFIPVILSSVMLRYIRNLFLYLFGAAAVCAVLFRVTGHAITLVCCILIFLIRCQTKIERGRIIRQMRDYPGEFGRIYAPQDWEIQTLLDKPRPIHWLFFIVEYMILIFSGRHQHLTGLFYLLFFEILVTVLFMYVDQIKHYIIKHEKITNLPGRMILRNGYVILAGVALIVLVFLMPSVLYGKEPLTGLYHEREETGFVLPEDLPLEERGEDPMLEMMMQLAGEQKPLPAWVGMLNRIIMWVLTAMICFFAIRMIFTMFARLLGSFAEEEEDEVINLKEVQEEEKRLRRAAKRKEKELRHTADYRIRKKYRKRILKASKEKPVGTETPLELEIHSALVDTPDSERLQKLYEKARYSYEECSTEEEKSFPG